MAEKLKLKNIMESAFIFPANPKPRLGEIQTDKDFPPFALSEQEWLEKWGLVKEGKWNRKKIEDLIQKHKDILVMIKSGSKNQWISLSKYDKQDFTNSGGVGNTSDGEAVEFNWKDIDVVNAAGKRLDEVNWTKKDFYAQYSRIGIGIKDIYKDGYTHPNDDPESVADDIYTEFGKLADKLAKKHKIKFDEVSIFLNKI